MVGWYPGVLRGRQADAEAAARRSCCEAGRWLCLQAPGFGAAVTAARPASWSLALRWATSSLAASFSRLWIAISRARCAAAPGGCAVVGGTAPWHSKECSLRVGSSARRKNSGSTALSRPRTSAFASARRRSKARLVPRAESVRPCAPRSPSGDWPRAKSAAPAVELNLPATAKSAGPPVRLRPGRLAVFGSDEGCEPPPSSCVFAPRPPPRPSPLADRGAPFSLQRSRCSRAFAAPRAEAARWRLGLWPRPEASLDLLGPIGGSAAVGPAALSFDLRSVVGGSATRGA
mmetsp:Transcript_17837/g.39214  ORF Transcript_17837/g.39214 Transcript_17837/m.39214 type:complete len:289 (-) Transcript_17837:14-880(-)